MDWNTCSSSTCLNNLSQLGDIIGGLAIMVAIASWLWIKFGPYIVAQFRYWRPTISFALDTVKMLVGEDTSNTISLNSLQELLKKAEVDNVILSTSDKAVLRKYYKIKNLGIIKSPWKLDSDNKPIWDKDVANVEICVSRRWYSDILALIAKYMKDKDLKLKVEMYWFLSLNEAERRQIEQEEV